MKFAHEASTHSKSFRVLRSLIIMGILAFILMYPVLGATVPSVVKVIGASGNWQLSVDNKPWYINGFCWGPDLSRTTIDGYMADAVSIGANTFRTWGTGADSGIILDSAAKYGAKICMGIWLQQNIDYATNTSYKSSVLSQISTWVNRYKSHPGVLMWDVGNEVILFLQNYYTNPEPQRIAYAQFIEQVAQTIHSLDPNHPVTSTDAWPGAWDYFKAYTPSLDLLAVNQYGGIDTVYNQWQSKNINKPYIITEFGPKGEWEFLNDANGVPMEHDDTEKAQGYHDAWTLHIAGHAGTTLGGFGFIYGEKEDFGGEWFNIKMVGGYKRPAYYTFKEAYSQVPYTGNRPPVINSMSLSKTSGIAKGSTVTITVSATDPDGDPMTYAVKQSSKYINANGAIVSSSFTQVSSGVLNLVAPTTAGVWKIYVYVYDGKGNVGIEPCSIQVI